MTRSALLIPGSHRAPACVGFLAMALGVLTTGTARADEANAELPPPVVRRVDHIEREMEELRALVRAQASQIQELERRTGVAPVAPVAPATATSCPPCPPCPPVFVRKEFAAPCPAPTPTATDPCACPEALGPCDPSLVAGYDRQFYVRSRSGRFKAMFGMYTQARWNWNRRETPPDDEEQDTTDWEMVRTRIFAEAEVTKYFYLHFRFNVSGTGDTQLIVSYIQVKPVDGLHVRIGRQFIALTREDWMYPQDLLTMDFSANDSIFGIGTSNAIQLRKTWDRDRFWLTVSDGAFGGGRTFGDTEQGEYAFSGRYEHQFLTTDWSLWDDLVGRRGRARGLLVGFAGGFQEGGTTSAARTGVIATADLSYNWDGGQALVYGSFIRSDNRDLGDVDYYGFLAQAGQFLSCSIQVYGRYEHVHTGKNLSDLQNYDSALVGVNWFPFQWTNRYKLTAEAGYLFSALSQTTVPSGTNIAFLPAERGDQFYLRMQLQFGF